MATQQHHNHAHANGHAHESGHGHHANGHGHADRDVQHFQAQWKMLGLLRWRLLRRDAQAMLPLLGVLLAVNAVLTRSLPGVWATLAATAVTAAVQRAAHAIGGAIIMPAQRRTVRWLKWLQRQAAHHKHKLPLLEAFEHHLDCATQVMERVEAHLPTARQRLLQGHRGQRLALHTPDGGTVDAIIFGRPDDGVSERCPGAVIYLGGNGACRGDASASILLAYEHFAWPNARRPLTPRTLRALMLCALVHAGEHYEFCDDMLHFRSRNLAVLLLNYRGVGESPGPCTRNGAVIDVATALAYLQHGCSIPPSRVILFGHSIGGGYSVEAARDFAGCLVVNDRSFATLSGVAQDHLTTMLGFGRHEPRAAPTRGAGRWKGALLRHGIRFLVRYIAAWELDSVHHFRHLARAGQPRVIIHTPQDAVIPRPYQLQVALQDPERSRSGSVGDDVDDGCDGDAGCGGAAAAASSSGGRRAANEAAGCIIELTPEKGAPHSRHDAHNRPLSRDEKQRLFELVSRFLAGLPLPAEA